MIDYIIVAVILAAVLGAWYVWEKGLLGTATEARLKAMRAKLAESMKNDLESLDQRIEAKIAARLAKQQAEVTLIKDKGNRIAENKALLDAKAITQEQYDAAVKDILTNG